MKVISVRDGGKSPYDMFVDEAQKPDVPPGFVLIRTIYAGVNRPDILQRRGLYPPPYGASPIMGLEVAGRIEAITPTQSYGDDIGWKVGDEVCALVNGGGYAEFVAVDIRHLLPIPLGLSLPESASLPEGALTVYANLMEHGALNAGETVLVHGANSGIGAMTIMMAKAFDARVIATARGAEKCAFAHRLGGDLIIDTDMEDFVPAVKTLGGADVVLDIVGGDFAAKNIDCLKFGGRLVQVGFGKTSKVEIDLRLIMQKQGIITGSVLRPRTPEEKARLSSRVRERVWPLIGAGQITPIVEKIFDFEDVAAAHTWLESGTHCGKVVLKL